MPCRLLQQVVVYSNECLPLLGVSEHGHQGKLDCTCEVVRQLRQEKHKQHKPTMITVCFRSQVWFELQVRRTMFGPLEVSILDLIVGPTWQKCL